MYFLSKIVSQTYWYLIILVPYFCGAFPSGYLIAKIFKVDITKKGSGNIGSTNVMRIISREAGLVTFTLDISKTILAFIFINLLIDSNKLVWIQLSTVLVILGHTKNIFLGFRGGKGVTNSFAVWFYLSLPSAIITSAIWILFFRWKRIVSFSSILSYLMLPIWIYFFNREFFFLSIVISLYLTLLHRENIKRLVKGTEQVLGKKT